MSAETKNLHTIAQLNQLTSILGFSSSGNLAPIPFILENQNISISRDFNDITQTGIYVLRYLMENAPKRADGNLINTCGAVLFVSDRGNGYCGQFLWSAVFSMGVYCRNMYAGSWSPWYMLDMTQVQV